MANRANIFEEITDGSLLTLAGEGAVRRMRVDQIRNTFYLSPLNRHYVPPSPLKGRRDSKYIQELMIMRKVTSIKQRKTENKSKTTSVKKTVRRMPSLAEFRNKIHIKGKPLSQIVIEERN